nr:NAD(P)H-hydrate dehydratase [Lachnospiraceae bacterium]
FGIGISRDITGEYYSVIENINNSGAVIYAVDVPSGINVDNGKVMNICVKADYTITFGINKLGLLLYPANSFCGKIIIKNIGFLKDVIAECTLRNNTKKYLDEDIKDILPLRKADSNKGTYKKLLIIAGNDNMCGAAYLAAKAAYKLGCGLCNIFTSKSNVNTLHGLIPEAIVSFYDTASEKDDDIINKLDGIIKEHDAVIIGPGTGISDLQKKMIKKVLEYDIPKVVDADAINNISLMDKHGINFSNVIFTPHLKELSRLIDKDVKYVKENKDDAIKLFYEQYNGDNNENVILVVKDARTYISNNSECYINLTGNHGLSTGGSGDVLTGIVASLLCQGEVYYMAAVKGVYIHGTCADNYAKRSNAYSLIASDIINELEHI